MSSSADRTVTIQNREDKHFCCAVTLAKAPLGKGNHVTVEGRRSLEKARIGQFYLGKFKEMRLQ
jgi:hypothetical protein